MEIKKHWAAERNSIFARSRGHLWETSGVILRYDPAPGDFEKALASGKPTTIQMTFPALVVLAMVKDGDKVAARIAQQLNTYPALLGALKRVESLMTELGAKGEPLKTVRAAIAAAEAEPEALS